MEQEQTVTQKRRGRPPKTEMTESRKKQSIEEDNNKLADFGLLHGEDGSENVVKSAQVEPETKNTVEETIDENVVENTQTEDSLGQGEMNSHLSDECIKRFANSIGKSYNYVIKRVLNQSCIENVIANVLDMVSESCLPVHKYNIGDWVYIPEQTVDNTQGGFGVIQVKFLRKPKKVQVNKIIYTNKIQYSFVGFKKLIVLEDYCCSTEAQCKALCDKLNK